MRTRWWTTHRSTWSCIHTFQPTHNSDPITFTYPQHLALILPRRMIEFDLVGIVRVPEPKTKGIVKRRVRDRRMIRAHKRDGNIDEDRLKGRRERRRLWG